MRFVQKIAAAVTLMIVSMPVFAKPVQVASLAVDVESAMPAMVEGPFALAPMGFIRFCMENPADCVAPAAEPVELTPPRFAQLQSVNLSVNRRIAPKADAPGQDIWSLGVSSGDCDDYAVQKRHELIALGWPQATLLFAAVTTPQGESHLILVVKTDRGDFILDNLRSQIVQTAASSYRWQKMQSARNPLYWVEVRRPELIAQVRQKQPALPVMAASKPMRPEILPQPSKPVEPVPYEVAELRVVPILAY